MHWPQHRQHPTHTNTLSIRTDWSTQRWTHPMLPVSGTTGHVVPDSFGGDFGDGFSCVFFSGIIITWYLKTRFLITEKNSILVVVWRNLTNETYPSLLWTSNISSHILNCQLDSSCMHYTPWKPTCPLKIHGWFRYIPYWKFVPLKRVDIR